MRSGCLPAAVSASVGLVGAGAGAWRGDRLCRVLRARLLRVLGDEAVDDGVEAGFGFAEFHDAGDGEVEEGFDAGEGDDEVVEMHDGVDFIVDGADVGGDVGVE